MLRSMTGFGRCYVENEALSQQWEIKSVNSRYLDLKWRLPPLARFMEPAFEKIVRRYATRGRLEVSLNLKFAPGSSPKPAFNTEQASAMLDALKRLALMRQERFEPDYGALLAIPGLWSEPEIEEMEDLAGMLEEGLVLTLEDWNESRETEGAHLNEDLQVRLKRLAEWTTLLTEAAPGVKEDRLQALRERLMAALAMSDGELDEDRFLQEMVILADRVDVSEELTRLAAHLERLRQLLRDGGDAGRKLDFTLQECFREINTCGNKLQDAELSMIVVDYKNELEKCREQVQNLE